MSDTMIIIACAVLFVIAILSGGLWAATWNVETNAQRKRKAKYLEVMNAIKVAENMAGIKDE